MSNLMDGRKGDAKLETLFTVHERTARGKINPLVSTGGEWLVSHRPSDIKNKKRSERETMRWGGAGLKSTDDQSGQLEARLSDI